ncbi:hypothetical protein ABZT51_07290 [Streptomyces sp. NPDC005373]|uniref:hypothetical protein n=1 Tax=Streptomyces sp. NPDC005373 TaxID=3156879 RepID=UPI0033B10198
MAPRGPDRFRRPAPPITHEQSEADTLLLTLAKSIVDGLDGKALRQMPGVTDAKAASLNCLDAWVTPLPQAGADRRHR